MNYTLIDNKIVKIRLERLEEFGVHIENFKDSEFKDLAWSLLEMDGRRRSKNGYVIYIPKKTKVLIPIYTCLLLKHKIVQKAHNIIVVDKGAEATILTSCSALVNEALHLTTSEFFVRKNAKLNFIMFHNWRYSSAKPKTATLIEENGEYLSLYVNVAPAREVVMYPKTILKKNAKANLFSILLVNDSYLDIGNEAIIAGKNARVNIVSKLVGKKGMGIARARIIAEEFGYGHIDCKGLQVGDATIKAIPELHSLKQAELSHEAYVGKIEEEKINYLLSKGLTRNEATQLIVSGFLKLPVEKLPENVREQVLVLEKMIAKQSTL